MGNDVDGPVNPALAGFGDDAGHIPGPTGPTAAGSSMSVGRRRV
jgi:hypothetical protein